MSVGTPAEKPADPAGGMPVVEVRDLCVDFGVDRQWVPAAVDLNFAVRAGEVLALVGESGSGKSACSMALMGLLPANSRVTGSVRFNGTEVLGLPANRLRQLRGNGIAVIFQEPTTAFNPVYTVGFQLVEALLVHRSPAPAQARERALELLALVELPDPQKVFAAYPHQLSGGQRQRALIAQALSCDPKLLIADEPTAALDVTVQAEILDLLRRLQDRLDTGIILITHDMGVVADLADRIAVMRRGRIVETGTASQVFAQPQHEYTRSLLAAVPRLGQDHGRLTKAAPPAAEQAAEQATEEAGPPVAAPANAAGQAAAVAASDAPVLVLRDVAIDYPGRGRGPAVRAVHNATLEIFPGEVLGLVGESGSGKTTLGRAAVGLLPIAAGTLTLAGTDVRAGRRRNPRPLQRRVGMVFQDPASSLNPRMPIGESIGEPLRLAGAARGRALQARIEDLLDQVELPRSYRNRYPHELSGGQKQRVGIARALALEPHLLVADEPTSALDVSVQARVLDLFGDLQRRHGFACLFITHDLAVVDVLADRIAVMHRGRIVEQGARQQVLSDPKDPYTRRLLAAVPLPDPERQRARRELRSRRG